MARVAREAVSPVGDVRPPLRDGEEHRVSRLPGGSISWILRRSARSRRLRVTIDPSRGVVVTVPPATRRGWRHPDAEIERFLGDREAWLRRHLARHAEVRSLLVGEGGVRDGRLVPFRGESHRLRIEHHGDRASEVTRVAAPGGPEVILQLGTRERRTPAGVLVPWLRDRAQRAIEVEIARHAAALAVSPSRVTIRDPRTRWGSASREGRLMFSWRLVLAPPEALETVVVHELAHLREFGHGPEFWSLVASRRPDHLAWRRWLRTHSVELHAAVTD